jgi:hypothetical protein
MTMTRVRFLRGTALGGVGNDAHPGDERDLPEARAVHYIAMGRAVAVSTAPSPAVTDEAAPAPKPRKGK